MTSIKVTNQNKSNKRKCACLQFKHTVMQTLDIGMLAMFALHFLVCLNRKHVYAYWTCFDLGPLGHAAYNIVQPPTGIVILANVHQIVMECLHYCVLEP